MKSNEKLSKESLINGDKSKCAEIFRHRPGGKDQAVAAVGINQEFPNTSAEKIKLVIWDLDDTVWNGTLSEGEVSVKDEISDLIRALPYRGVINSVCSKNDEAQAFEKLRELNLLDSIVYCSVNWESKAQRIRNIISMLQLRACNVLFVDDNDFNLREAKFLLPDLQVIKADNLIEALERKDVLFAEKDDKNRTRHNQYKILVRRSEKKSSYSSNEQFLWDSDITVECLEDNEEYFERIHEMITRNNQLNFTKNRISLDEVRTLFSDPSVRSGCVLVKDRYGDHGIAGCYAVKDNRLEQFVFSCRILNMGVEQWVYAMLGYPDITVAQPVASHLVKNSKPEWINRNEKRVEKSPLNVNDKRILVYGSCPLRPVWAYLEPIFPNSYFAEIDPEPSICNLAVAAAESKEYINSVLKKVGTFHQKYTFDRNIFLNGVDYVLVSLDEAMSFYKYSCDGHHFYSKKLTEQSAENDILQNYTEEPIDYNDIEISLEIIADQMKNTVLMIMLNPETEFPLKGKNTDYQRRIRLNSLAEKLSSRRNNIRLIDIRKYTGSPLDFYDTYAGHFNRSIAYKVAQDIVKIIAPDSYHDKSVNLPKGVSLVKNVTVELDKSVVLEISIGIRNGVLTLSVKDAQDSGRIDDCTFDYELYCGSVRESFIKYTDKQNVQIHCGHPGVYYGWVTVRDANGSQHRYLSESLNYTEFNYFLYEDFSDSESVGHLEDIKQFCEKNSETRKTVSEAIADIANLSAEGVSISDYFLFRDIKEIYLFTDDEFGNVIIPFLLKSGINIKHIYSIDAKSYFAFEGGTTLLLTDNINKIEIENGEHILFAYSGREYEKWTWLLKIKGAQIHVLSYVISALKTKTYFLHRVCSMNLPRVICVRSPHLHPFYSFPYTSVLASEKALKKIETEPPQKTVDPVSHIRLWKDRTLDGETIVNGIRKTSGQPEDCNRSIYVFGDSYVYGYGVADDQTIPSNLQVLCKEEYTVRNMANIFEMTDGDHIIRSIFNRHYKSDDIIVILHTCWMQKDALKRWHWFNWEECENTDTVETLDAFPLFMDRDRKEYFLTKGAYNAEGNRALAELIWNYLKEGKSK